MRIFTTATLFKILVCLYSSTTMYHFSQRRFTVYNRCFLLRIFGKILYNVESLHVILECLPRNGNEGGAIRGAPAVV